MNFYSFNLSCDDIKTPVKGREKFYAGMTSFWMEEFVKSKNGKTQDSYGMTPAQCLIQTMTEWRWLEAKQPYYNVWPAITQPLLKTKLDIPGKYLQLPVDPICLRFPTDAKYQLRLSDNSPPVRSLLASRRGVHDDDDDKGGLSIWADFGERQVVEHPDFGNVDISLKSFLVSSLEEETIEHGIDKIVYNNNEYYQGFEKEALREAARLVLACCLLHNDPTMFEPEVLSKDALRYERTKEQALVDKAVRRGKVGWNVGKSLGTEIAPHIRRPHFAIRWTGEGGKIPKLTPISGSVVHRTRMKKVPTGYEDVNKGKD